VGIAFVSLRVEPDALGEHLAGRDFAYVLTVRDGGVHAIAHRVVVDRGAVTVVNAGESLVQRLANEAPVTVLWPPATRPSDEHAHYSLVADGIARSRDGSLVIDIATAVLHRPAP
jgi:hypothetical protein